jgi:hypothetical protein
VEYLNKGHFYEKSVLLLQELQVLYRDTLFDYESLADTLEQEVERTLIVRESQR